MGTFSRNGTQKTTTNGIHSRTMHDCCYLYHVYTTLHFTVYDTVRHSTVYDNPNRLHVATNTIMAKSLSGELIE